MLGRGRREERREERQAGRQGPGGDGGANRFQMREKLVSIGDDFWIENAQGQRAFKVDGKALRVRDTLTMRDAQGHEVAKIQERMINIRDTMKIERPGKPDATVKKAMITPLRERFTLEAGDVGEIDIQGNLLDHEYTFEKGGQKIAETSKRWFRVRDSYGVEIAPGQDEALILAATVVIDQMSHDVR
jgi:uncharacterized protein YxjI